VTDEEWDAHMRAGEPIGHEHFIFRAYITPDDRCIYYPADQAPPDGSVFIGIMDHHKAPNGAWCGGYVHFRNVPEAVANEGRLGAANHELVSAEPLTISPSLGCRQCPSHGFIRNGSWEEC
jgi:hypothetical protein